jgi:O-antigen/teichoic acid export membrane protein
LKITFVTKQIVNTVKLLGIDGAIFFTLMGKIVQASGGIISIYFISRYLNLIEQGYYYTFGSILSIQIFFELGLSGVITQFVAHEVALLKWEKGVYLVGPEESLSRLSSLLRFCIKWFSFLAFILFIILLIVGIFFFRKYGLKDNTVDWIFPWIIISIATSCSFILSPILAFLEGLGKIKSVATIRLIQQLFQITLFFIFLVLKFKIYSSPIAYLFAILIIPLIINNSNNSLILKNIWGQIKFSKIDYFEEIFPFQWRIALSWISGFFMYQLFNPVIFATDGPIVAGQMGVSLVVLNGVLSISISWVSTKIPLFSNLIAKKEFSQLDSLFKKTIIQTSSVSLIGVFILIFSLYLFQINNIPLRNRFLPMMPFIILAVSTFVNQFVAALAIYLRCHKKEPFLIFSFVLAVLTTISTLLFGKLYGLKGVTFGYSFLTIFVSFPWAVLIFNNKRKLWHQVVIQN